MYVLGGVQFFDDCPEAYKYCSSYSIKTKRWSKVESMNVARYQAACTVFEGKVVVSGGFRRGFFKKSIKSVEAYDYYVNKWTNLPDMVEGRSDHAAVSMGNKMFVIGGDHNLNCEIFDSFSRNFCALKLEIPVLENKDSVIRAVCISSKITIFYRVYGEAAVFGKCVYDTIEKNTSEFVYWKKYFSDFNCLKLS